MALSMSSSELSIVNNNVDGSILDGFMLLEASHAEVPEAAVKVSLIGARIIGVVAQDLRYFSRLSVADFSENKIGLGELCDLEALEELRLRCNGIQTISWTVESPFPNLTILDLSYNNILPSMIEKLASLKHLRDLDLGGNQLEMIPKTIHNLVNVEILCLAGNKLKDAESLVNVSVMPRLRELDVSNNRFTRVPFACTFPRLQWLNLSKNCILDENDIRSINQFQQLTQVLLFGNPFTNIKAVAVDENGEIETPGTSLRSSINVVTNAPEAPKPRSVASNYSDIRFARVEEEPMRSAQEWRKIGNEMIMNMVENGGVYLMDKSDEMERLEDAPDPAASDRSIPKTGPREVSGGGGGVFLTSVGIDDDDDDSCGETDTNYEENTREEEKFVPGRDIETLRMQLVQLGGQSNPAAKPDAGKLRAAVSELRHLLKNPPTSLVNPDRINHSKNTTSRVSNPKSKTKKRANATMPRDPTIVHKIEGVLDIVDMNG